VLLLLLTPQQVPPSFVGLESASEAAVEIYEGLEPIVRADDPANDWTALKLCMAIVAGDVDFIHEIVTDGPTGAGWEVLLDPDRCPVKALPFLAQFDGAILTSDMSEASRRAAITSPESFQRGTVEAIRSVVRRRLSGERIVNITERYTGNVWRIHVTTNKAETPEEAATIADLERYAKPIGILLFFNGAAAWTWGEVAAEIATYPTWASIASNFATWGDFVSHEP
jgi:phage tail P2-like protein